MTEIEPGKYLVVRREGDSTKGSRSQGTIRVPKGSSVTLTNQVDVPPPPPPPPPPTGLPVIDPTLGKTFRKVFTDGTLAPFANLTWLDDHIGEVNQFMTVFNRFAHNRLPTVHDGYLDLQATRTSNPDLWDSDFVGTGPLYGFGVFRFWLRFNIAPATWQAAWLFDTGNWSAEEIDFPEMLENQSLTLHKLGAGAGGKYGIAKPADLGTKFHEFRIERRATFIEAAIDGVVVGRLNGSYQPTKLAILLDSCVGHPWVNSDGGITSATPNPTFLHVAGVTVDA